MLHVSQGLPNFVQTEAFRRLEKPLESCVVVLVTCHEKKTLITCVLVISTFESQERDFRGKQNNQIWSIQSNSIGLHLWECACIHIPRLMVSTADGIHFTKDDPTNTFEF